MTKNFPYHYICIEGNIGAGKTSFCELIHNQYNCNIILEEFDENPFLPYFYEDRVRYAFPVELFFLTERYKQLEAKVLQRELFASFTISDYFFTKSLLFAKNNLISSEYRMFEKMFTTLNTTAPKPDLLVYFHRDVEILKKMILQRGRSYELLIETDYLQSIQDSYFEYFRDILTYPVLIIDLKETDFINNSQYFEAIISLLSRNYLPGVHRISLAS